MNVYVDKKCLKALAKALQHISILHRNGVPDEISLELDFVRYHLEHLICKVLGTFKYTTEEVSRVSTEVLIKHNLVGTIKKVEIGRDIGKFRIIEDFKLKNSSDELGDDNYLDSEELPLYDTFDDALYTLLENYTEYKFLELTKGFEKL